LSADCASARTKEQRIDPRVAADELQHLLRASLVEQPIAVCAECVDIALAGERSAKVAFRGRIVAAGRDLGKQRLGPRHAGAIDARSVAQRPAHRLVGRHFVAGHAVDRGDADDPVDFGRDAGEATAIGSRLAIAAHHRSARSRA
jgi:hypothetical protein